MKTKIPVIDQSCQGTQCSRAKFLFEHVERQALNGEKLLQAYKESKTDVCLNINELTALITNKHQQGV